MNREIIEWYPPQRGFRQTRPFLIVFGVFILAGLAVLFSGLTGPGLALSGMGLIFYALILPQAAAVGKRYGLCQDLLILKTLTKENSIPLSEIESLALLSKDESRRFMEELYRSSVDAERQMNMSSWLRSQRRAGEVVRFLSVPVTGTEARRGHSTNITDYSVKPDAELLLLRLSPQRMLLVSPQDIRKFHLKLVQKGVSLRPYMIGEGSSLQAESAASGGMKKVVGVISIVTFIITLVLIGYFVIYPQFTAQQYSEDPVPVTEDSVIPHAFWADNHTFIFVVLKDELPEMERAGGVTAALFSIYAAPRMIELLETGGEIPQGSSERAELLKYLGEFLVLHSRILFVGEELDEDGKVLNVFQVEQTEMRTSVASLLRNF